MKRCLLLILTVACLLPLRAQEGREALDARLTEYFAALEQESLSVKMEEADYIIASCREQQTRDYVATRVYRHFLESSLMGDEAVAIHLTDTWFAPGKASFPSELDLMNARIFADFNRHSLLGLDAPPLRLQRPEGDWAEALPEGERLKVLLFHDTDCATCKIEHVLLRQFLRRPTCPLEVVAVYTGSDAAAWAGYRQSMAELEGPSVHISHYWDPELASDYQMLYGVLQTPRMFLLDGRNVILGRGLDTPALQQLLERLLASPQTYGSPEADELFARLFEEAPLGTAPVREVADLLEKQTLRQGNMLMYKQLTGDLLYWLSTERGEGAKQAAVYVADSLVLSRPDIWQTRSDSLQVVGLARMTRDLWDRAAIGSVVPALRVKGTLVRPCGQRKVCRRLDRLRRPSYVVFYSEGCGTCREELAALPAVRDTAVLLVDLDAVARQNPALSEALLDAFDLSVLPHIVLLDRKGVILRKYLSFLNKETGPAGGSVSEG